MDHLQHKNEVISGCFLHAISMPLHMHRRYGALCLKKPMQVRLPEECCESHSPRAVLRSLMDLHLLTWSGIPSLETHLEPCCAPLVSAACLPPVCNSDINTDMHQWSRESRVMMLPNGSDTQDWVATICRVLKIVSMGPVKSFCHHRLQLLEQKFNLHMMLNADKEFLAQKSAPHRDFYNVRKVCSLALSRPIGMVP